MAVEIDASSITAEPTAVVLAVEPRQAPLGRQETRSGAAQGTASGAALQRAECRHDWIQAEQARQSLEAEGKTVWVCRNCSALTHTYSWRTPA